MADQVDNADEAPEDATDVLSGDTERLYGVEVTRSRGQLVLHPERHRLIETVTEAKNDGFDMCIDVTCVDYLQQPGRELPPQVMGERFEVVIELISHTRRERMRLRVQVPDSDPVLPSLFDLYPGSEALEREAYDMFGITFDNHPDMTRILMPEDWTGHPLRKDYAVGDIPVQFKAPLRPR